MVNISSRESTICCISPPPSAAVSMLSSKGISGSNVNLPTTGDSSTFTFTSSVIISKSNFWFWKRLLRDPGSKWITGYSYSDITSCRTLFVDGFYWPKGCDWASFICQQRGRQGVRSGRDYYCSSRWVIRLNRCCLQQVSFRNQLLMNQNKVCYYRRVCKSVFQTYIWIIINRLLCSMLLFGWSGIQFIAHLNIEKSISSLTQDGNKEQKNDMTELKAISDGDIVVGMLQTIFGKSSFKVLVKLSKTAGGITGGGASGCPYMTNILLGSTTLQYSSMASQSPSASATTP